MKNVLLCISACLLTVGLWAFALLIAVALGGCGGSVEPTPTPTPSPENFCTLRADGCEYTWPIPQSQLDAREIVCPPDAALKADPTTTKQCATTEATPEAGGDITLCPPGVLIVGRGPSAPPPVRECLWRPGNQPNSWCCQ